MNVGNIFFIGLSVFALTATNLSAAEKEKPAHKSHQEHQHKHGTKDCAHKAEKHGDHTDYEDDGHHHKKHGKHYDECHGPEADAKTETKAAE